VCLHGGKGYSRRKTPKRKSPRKVEKTTKLKEQEVIIRGERKRRGSSSQTDVSMEGREKK